MARHKKAHHEEHMDESWLIPYADLLTLLLALFIVLFASSTVDSDKYQAMQQAFGKEIGVLPESGSTIAPDSPGGIMESVNPSQPSGTGEETGTGKEDQIGDLESAFKTYVVDNSLSDQVKLEKKDDGLLVTLTSDVWFALGSAEINQSHVQVAKEVEKMIEENQKGRVPFKVIVTGHTDNLPIKNGQYKSNWQLSLARAVNFMEILMDNSTLDPSNFSARGMGEYDPIDTNDTPEGRQHNRRVEVYISFDKEMTPE